MSTSPLLLRTTTLFRVAILVLAPAFALVGHAYHPWIGNPSNAGFFARLADAVAADPTRWGISHLMIGVGSGLVALAFLALRSYLRDAGEERWSAVGLPFIIFGSSLYALLPAMEFAAYAAARTGADVAATQLAVAPWFLTILRSAAVLFALGAIGFAAGIVKSGVFGRTLSWLVVAALIVMAGSRFLQVGAAQLYIGPAAALIALWPLAYVVWKRPRPVDVEASDVRPSAEEGPKRRRNAATRFAARASGDETKRQRTRGR